MKIEVLCGEKSRWLLTAQMKMHNNSRYGLTGKISRMNSEEAKVGLHWLKVAGFIVDAASYLTRCLLSGSRLVVGFGSHTNPSVKEKVFRKLLHSLLKSNWTRSCQVWPQKLMFMALDYKRVIEISSKETTITDCQEVVKFNPRLTCRNKYSGSTHYCLAQYGRLLFGFHAAGPHIRS